MRLGFACGNKEKRYNMNPTGRGSVRIERTVRVREVGGSNPPAPTETLHHNEGFFVNVHIHCQLC